MVCGPASSLSESRSPISVAEFFRTERPIAPVVRCVRARRGRHETGFRRSRSPSPGSSPRPWPQPGPHGGWAWPKDSRDSLMASGTAPKLAIYRLKTLPRRLFKRSFSRLRSILLDLGPADRLALQESRRAKSIGSGSSGQGRYSDWRPAPFKRCHSAAMFVKSTLSRWLVPTPPPLPSEPPPPSPFGSVKPRRNS
jgi:hypothetical protein